MTDTAPDALVEALARGEDAAWREFVRSYGRLVYFAAHKVGLDASEHEEVLQDTLVAVHGAIGRLRRADRLASWVYVIARRVALQRIAAGRREVRLAGDDPFLEVLAGVSDPDFAEALERFEDMSRLDDALDAISERCRRLLRMLYLEDPRPSYEAISEREGLPVGSIGPTRGRCLKQLSTLFIASERDDAREPEGDSRP